MWFHSLVASWKSASSRSRRPQPKPARRSTRLFLEHLEDRSLPSNYSAATASDLIADINAANTAGGANTITLTAPTTSPYVLPGENNSTLGWTQLPVITSNLTIVGNGDSVQGSVGEEGRLLAVTGGASLTLVDLTLTGGRVPVYDNIPGTGQTWMLGGGAICNLGTLVLNGVTVTGNEVTGWGGSVDLSSGKVDYGESAVGGGIWSNFGSLTLENGTLVQGNEALGANGVWWGSSYSDGVPITVGTPSNAMGGGVYVAGGTVIVTNSTISGNQAVAGYPPPNYPKYTATSYGGGIYVAAGQVTLTASTVNGNSAAGMWLAASAAAYTLPAAR